MSQGNASLVERRFILCRRCDVVHHVSAFDRARLGRRAPAEAQEFPADDWRAFMDQHAGHRLEPLQAVDEYFFPEGLAADPMAVAYLKVSDGQREYILRRRRRAITEPLRFEPIGGKFSVSATAFEIQERELRKELRLRFRLDDGQLLSAAKIEQFIGLFRAAASQVAARGAGTTEPSYDNDNILYAALEPDIKDFLLEQCASCFTAAEVRALRRFIETHNNDSDVMTLVQRRQIAVVDGL